MSDEEQAAFDERFPALENLIEAKRKEQRSKMIFYIALVVVLLAVLGLAFFQYDNYRNDEVERLASEEVGEQLVALCEGGQIDCEGTRGLPGPKGTPGIGIAKQTCDFGTGKFEFTYTSGKVRQIGDCVAEDGARGPRGHVGPRGPQGFTGHKGDRGPRGFRGHKGKSGALLGHPRLILSGEEVIIEETP